MPLIPAPPDLAALIDEHRAAADTAAWVRTHYALMRWPGWGKKNRTTYTHGGARVARIWGSLKIDERPTGEED